MRLLIALVRILVAAAIVAAVVGQLATSLDFWRAAGVQNLAVSVTNFFSFFTIESNVLAALLLVVGAVRLLRRGGGTRGAGGRGARGSAGAYDVARLAVTTYMVTTGIVYNLLLRGIELPQGSTLGWSNEILHVVAPAWLLIDWLVAPDRRALGSRAVGAVVVFPIVWAVYTLVRGPLTVDEVQGKDVWYPYPFLNPTLAPQGYSSVAFYVLLIAAIITLVALGLARTSRGRAGR